MIPKKRLLRKIAKICAPALYANYFRNTKPTLPIGKTIITFSFDCDLAEDYEKLPLLLDSLKKYNVKVTFGIIGKWLEAKPEIHKRIVQEGHEIMNHTYSHPDNEVFHPNEHFNELPFERQEKQIIDFHKTAQKILGITPIGFRTPHFGDLHTPQVYSVLENLGYIYSTSTLLTKTKTKGVPYYPSKDDYLNTSSNTYAILEMPATTCPVHYFPAFDSVHCIRQAEPAHPSKEFYTTFKKAIAFGKKHGIPLIFDFGPQDVGGNPNFEDILKEVTTDSNITLMNCVTLAKFYKEKLK